MIQPLLPGLLGSLPIARNKGVVLRVLLDADEEEGADDVYERGVCRSSLPFEPFLSTLQIEYGPQGNLAVDVYASCLRRDVGF